MSFDFGARVERLQALMGQAEIDVTLLSIGADLPYFIGFEAAPSERITVLVVPARGEPTLFLPHLEAPQVEEGEFDVRPWRETDEPVRMAAALFETPGRIAVGDHMWSVFLTQFQTEWTHAEWLPASTITTELRMHKDQMEIDLLRQAAHGVDRVMGRIPTEIPFGGRTEVDVARDLQALTVAEGHDHAEFAIVASGPHGASPHHHPGERRMGVGDLIVCDFGGRVGGYFSDSTRTFVVGEPTQRQQDVHDVVAAANAEGRAAAGPGVPCHEVDRAARSVIEAAGFGDYFIHRTGHGIGLEVHEHPYIVEGNIRPLESGMSFSVEPGVYLPDEFGVRIEDIVVCTDTGVESLNSSDRSLVEVG